MPVARTLKNPVAILDLGSNAVRFVIYDAPDRAPVKIHNERVQCHLGKGLAKTGYLNPAGVVLAFEAIGRFAALIKSMKIRHVHAVATAAMRDAADGPDFIASVKKAFGLTIRVVAGEEEARLSAHGVLMNGLGVEAKGHSGIIGDYGGGSLELIVVEKGKVRHKASFPLGAHRLQAIDGRAAQIKAIDAMLKTAPFLKKNTGMDFYAMGGAWRSIGRAHMGLANHPLPVLDHYAVDGAAATDFTGVLSEQSLAQLQKKLGGMEKRLHDMGVAALALHRVFRLLKPARLVFSGTGLREGLMYDKLTAAQKRQDALLASSGKIALRSGRFDDLKPYETLENFIAPLFAKAGKDVRRLVSAACRLSDICWFDHEDVQAAHALAHTLTAPLYGISHSGRAFLAIAEAVRYGEKPQHENLAALHGVLDGLDAQAVTTGHALHLAHLLTGGALSLLAGAKLKTTPQKLTLLLAGAAGGLQAENVDKALQTLAESTDRRAEIVFD
jgi:exopolyphosphatase/guanosine-5'-triphosphate,3'-diphosphate pyrophosphatase